MPSGRAVTTEAAQADVEDFEFMLSTGETIENACARLGLHARTMMRRYQRLGRPLPAGLAARSGRAAS